MPSQKTFRIKRVLAKKAKQNRPIPHWIRFRTNNKIRCVGFAVNHRQQPPCLSSGGVGPLGAVTAPDKPQLSSLAAPSTYVLSDLHLGQVQR